MEETVAWPGVPTYVASGFTMSTVNLKYVAGYSIFPGGEVGLFCMEVVGPQQPTMWRSHLTTKDSAVRMAQEMCDYVEMYLNEMRVTIRPKEDLSFDDFIQHLKTRIKNEFH